MDIGHRQQIIDQQDSRIATLEAENRDLKERIRISQAASRIAVAVEDELNTASEQGQIDEDAEAMAQVAVCAAERDKLTHSKAQQLQEDHYNEYAEAFREGEGPAIKKQLVAQFQSDGTYTQIEVKVKAKVTDELEAEVLAEQAAAIRDELTTNEQREAMKQAIRDEMEQSGQIDRIRQAKRADIQNALVPAVNAEVEKEVHDEEMAREAEFRAAYAVKRRASPEILKQHERIRQQLEAEWINASDADLEAAAGDERFSVVLKAEAAKRAAKLERDYAAMELLEEFEGFGIDTSKITEHTKVVVYLGSVGEWDIEKKDSRGYSEGNKTRVKGIICRRQLQFRALGDGRFRVTSDSLAESESVYDQEAALQPGDTVILGHRITENGKSTLEPRLTADSPLYYDSNTEDNQITNAKLLVADVHLNDISARGLEHYKMV